MSRLAIRPLESADCLTSLAEKMTLQAIGWDGGSGHRLHIGFLGSSRDHSGANMNKFLVASAGAIALFAAQPATAADLPVKAP